MSGFLRRTFIANAASAIAVVLALIAAPSAALQPDEILDDPQLEERARDISEGLRCLVCRNESIDESNADLARDLRLLVRERLVAGDTDDEVVDYIVDRYGEYVLLRPQGGGTNILLWGAGPLMLLVAAGIVFFYLRRRSFDPAEADRGLSDSEKARLDKIMEE